MNPLQGMAQIAHVLAMGFALLYGGFRERALWVLTVLSAAAALLLQTVVLGRAWLATGIPPAVNLPEILRMAAWALLFLYFLLYPILRSRILAFFLMPLSALCALLGGVLPSPAAEPKPFYGTAWFAVHILLFVFGIAFFFLSFLYATIFIMQDHSLRQRRAPPPLPLPSLEEADRWSSRLLLVGYPLFTLGILSSALYGALHRAGPAYRPGLLEAASLVAWVVLGLAIYGWITARFHPRRRSYLVVAGAAFTVLTLLGIVWH